jgi:hypothetical protein
MKLGLGLEKEVMTTYTSNTYPEARVLYPCVVAHKTLPYLCCSPDAIIARETKRNLLVEVKTSVTLPAPSSYRDQVQFNMLITGCLECVVLFYMTHTGQNKLSDMSLHKITAFRIYADQSWRDEFLPKAAFFYDTYLKWAYCVPPDVPNGQGVVEVLKSQSNVKKNKVHTP